MKQLLTIIISMLLVSPAYAVVEWSKTDPLGTRNVSDIDYYVGNNNANLDRLVANYNRGVAISYNDTASVSVSAGELTCSNSAGTVRRMRKNSSAVTSVWTVGDNGLDAGAEAASTTYYVYADCDADLETYKIKLSANSSTPTGLTYYKRIGSFYNNSSSNIEQVSNDTSNILIAQGTVANGGTIALPTGYAQDQCKWIVSMGSVTPGIYGTYDVNFTASASRVVTATWTRCNWVGGSCPDSTISGTANYMIACNK